MRPSRQPNGEGGANVETLDRVGLFPSIGKHTPEQYKDDGNHNQVRRGVYQGKIRGLADANHFGSQRAKRAVYESVEAPLVSVHSSAKYHIKILNKRRGQ